MKIICPKPRRRIANAKKNLWLRLTISLLVLNGSVWQSCVISAAKMPTRIAPRIYLAWNPSCSSWSKTTLWAKTPVKSDFFVSLLSSRSSFKNKPFFFGNFMWNTKHLLILEALFLMNSGSAWLYQVEKFIMALNFTWICMSLITQEKHGHMSKVLIFKKELSNFTGILCKWEQDVGHASESLPCSRRSRLSPLGTWSTKIK